MKRTKIICTLGPACGDYDSIAKMLQSGMNVARLNMSHGNLTSHQKLIDIVKTVRQDLAMPCAILLDTRGPEIRMGQFDNDKVAIKAGDKFTFTSKDVVGDNSIVSINYPPIIKIAKKNNSAKIYANNGLLAFDILEVSKTDIICKVLYDGVLSSNKSFSVPHVCLEMPYLSDIDKQHLAFAVKNDLEMIACSWVNSANDVDDVKSYLKSVGSKPEIEIISKIESQRGLDNLEEIIDVSDGIMIARGDLATEIPLEAIPSAQKAMIKKAKQKGKTVIVATEMLESMIEQVRPTRAEVNDVACAVFDFASATMLSGESAAGKYPIKAVFAMNDIALAAEKHIDYDDRFLKLNFDNLHPIDAVSYSACSTATALKAKAIVCFSNTGNTVKRISKFRPSAAVFAMVLDKKTYHKLSLVWGVTPVLHGKLKNLDEMFAYANQLVKDHAVAQKGDTIIITSGYSSVLMEPTNMIKISIVD